MPQVLVYGGNGQLGQVLVTALNAASFETISVDIRPSTIATHSIVVPSNVSLAEQTNSIIGALKEKNASLCAVISVAGGWQGGSAGSDEFIESVERMWSVNVQSAIAASHLAAKFLQENGLVVLTGSGAVLGPTPGMIGYGIAKAATHHLVGSLSAPSSGLPKDTTVAAILPIMMDTATNRAAMPTADRSTWTPLEEVANLLVNWAKGNGRPNSGAQIKITTEANRTSFITL
eukprot:TRINITY_DN1118_c0_g1_i1.p1 TRINITY_DN1118_c0_g1~~TRINITY_DN1118_c0_g1_i1.p1  ORF type:complete len:232 (-),score=142.53 TRINITY_DN1118_c0_g1_i1:223-918(-)